MSSAPIQSMEDSMNDDLKRELQKVADVVENAVYFHEKRDEMNAAGHRAGTVRYSPITTSLQTASESLKRLIEEGR